MIIQRSIREHSHYLFEGLIPFYINLFQIFLQETFSRNFPKSARERYLVSVEIRNKDRIIQRHVLIYFQKLFFFQKLFKKASVSVEMRNKDGIKKREIKMGEKWDNPATCPDLFSETFFLPETF